MAKERSTPNWYKIRNEGNSPELLIYGYIGHGEDVDFIDLQAQVMNLSRSSRELTVRIHSGGGSVIDGLPIFDTLDNSGLKITTVIDGMAASMASVLSQVGAIRKMASNGMIMIHRVKGGSYGTSDDIRAYADLVDERETRIKEIFTEKTGQEADTVNGWFSKNTDWWINAKEALQLGLVDEIIETSKKPSVSNISKGLDEHKVYDLLRNTIDIPKEFVQMDNLARVKNELENVKQSRATLLIAQSLKDGRIKDDKVEFYTDLATNNYELAEQIISQFPERPKNVVVNVGLVQNGNPVETTVSKENWTLDDYRKKAPQDLENNPELYNELIQKKFKQ